MKLGKCKIKRFLDFFYKNRKVYVYKQKLAKIKFLEAKYYKRIYQYLCFWLFIFNKLKLLANKYSTIEGLEKILLNEINVEEIKDS